MHAGKCELLDSNNPHVHMCNIYHFLSIIKIYETYDAIDILLFLLFFFVTIYSSKRHLHSAGKSQNYKIMPKHLIY